MARGGQNLAEVAEVRGRRSGGSRGRKSKAEEVVPPIRRPKTLQLRAIRESGAAAIHEAVLKILWELGLKVEDTAARALLLRNGCREGDGGRIHYPRDLVARSLESLPDSIRLYDRDGRQVVDTAGPTPCFTAGHNCVQLLDHETGAHRPCTLADIERASKVQEALPHIDALASLGYPGDVPVEDEALMTVKALAKYSKKPIVFTGHDEHEVAGIWDFLGTEAGGADRLAEKPTGLDLIGPVSPLKLGEETCRRLIMAAERHLPVVCYPAIFPGMACPISLAGAIAQSSAESLAGVVISQLVSPGAPVMAGSSILPMDMRRADLAYGSPEYALGGLGSADYLNYIGLPCWTGAGCSDAHVLNEQAAAEAGSNMTVAALAGTSFIHNLGFLSGGRTGSLEMLVLCDELAGMVGRLAAGVAVEPEDIAYEVIERAALDNAFLTDPHTFERYETELWIPGLFERSDVSMWLESGAPPLRERIKDKLNDILQH